MGKRREPRKTVAVPVRIFGTDGDGKIFSENVPTIDVSRSGAKLGGVKAKLQLEEIVGLTYGKNKVHFRVKWCGIPGTPSEGTVGLLNLSPEKPLWDFPLPISELDSFQNRAEERRRWPRIKCSVSIEIRQPGQAVIWGKASDLSQGGCFVEMAIPLAIGTEFDIALWLRDTKLPLNGRVVSVAPGFGNGVSFIDLSSEHQEYLRRFIESITPTGEARLAFVKRSGL